MRVIKVVLCSPDDVRDARAAARRAAEEVNRFLAMANRDVQINVIGWETDAYPGLHDMGPQGKIDADLEIEQADVVIGIFWRRFGTPVHDAASATEHEIRLAYHYWEQRQTPDVWLYFDTTAASPISSLEAEQWLQVMRFREEFSARGLCRTYGSTEEFERKLRFDLLDYSLKRVPLTYASPDVEAEPLVEYRVLGSIAEVAAEGLTEPAGEMILEFHADLPPKDTVVNIHALFTTLVTNAVMRDGISDAIAEARNGEVLANGKIRGNALVFENVLLRWGGGQRTWISIKNIALNANGIGGTALAQIVVESSSRIASSNTAVAVALSRPGLSFQVRDAGSDSPLAAPGVILRQNEPAPGKPIAHLRFTQLFHNAFRYANTSPRATRLKAYFRSIPQGVRLYVSTNSIGDRICALLTGQESGPFRPVSPSRTIDGVDVVELAQESVGSSSRSVAIWELRYPSKIDNNGLLIYDFAIFVDYEPNPAEIRPALGRLIVNGSLAPTSTVSTAASSDIDVPRYVDTSTARPLLLIVPAE